MNFPNIKFETKVNRTQLIALKSNEKSIQRLCRNIQLSKIISIFVPEIMTVDSLNYSYYSVEHFKIADIFTKNFIDGYVLNGDLCLASLSNIDSCENCQIFLAEKKLTLRLDRELYYSLNAVHLTKYLKKHEIDKLFVSFELDLAINDNYQKIRNELLSDEIDKLNINFVWKPTMEDICPSSLAKFLTDMGYSVSDCENKFVNNLLFSINVPKLPTSSVLNDDTCDEWNNIMNNIGMLMLNCDTDEIQLNESDDVVKIKRGNVLHYKGFVPSSIIDDLFKEIQNTLTENSSLPYIAISSIPFSNLQRNFHTKLFFLTSENLYALE